MTTTSTQPRLTWTTLGMGAIGDAHGPIYTERATLPDGTVITRRVGSTARGTRRVLDYSRAGRTYRTLAEAMGR